MKKSVLLLVIGLLVLLLVACGGGPAGGPAGGPEAAEEGESAAAESSSDEAAESDEAVADEGPQLAPELSVYNWADYIDQDMVAACFTLPTLWAYHVVSSYSVAIPEVAD